MHQKNIAFRPEPPSLWHTLLEYRALIEIGLLPYLFPLLQLTPRGDGHPVLLVPGFIASESSLVGLRAFLRSRGHDVDSWGLGRNTGVHPRTTRALEKKIRSLHARHGRKVSVVGWSLGGVYAFHVAHAAPECVRSVVSLGSPMRIPPDGVSVPRLARALYNRLSHPLATPHATRRRKRPLEPPPVPSTCIYSATDGVVPAHAAQLDGNTSTHENVWVPGSHVGLGFNAAVMWVLADRLARPEGDARPFAPRGWLGKIYERLATLPLKY